MAGKKRGHGRRRKVAVNPQTGEGIGDFFKQVYKKVLKPTHDVLRKVQPSRIMEPLMPALVKIPKVGPAMPIITEGLKTVGYGRGGRAGGRRYAPVLRL